jgi:type I restriction enzyme S subunit
MVAKVEWGNTSITKKSYVPSGYTAFSASGPDGFLPHSEWNGPAVILSAIGAKCGKCFYAQNHWTAIKNTIVIQGDEEKIIHKMLYYYLNDASKWYISGSGQPFITLKTARETVVPVPPPNVQKQIVAEIEKQFSRLDEAVTELKRIQANLKRYKAAVLKAAVEGKLTEQWRKEHPDVEPADQLLKRILAERRAKWEAEELAKMKAKAIKPKDDSWKKKYKEPAGPDTANLPELPEGWGWATLQQIGELNRGKSKHRPRNAPHLYGGPYPFVQTGDIRAANRMLKSYIQTYSEAGLEQSKIWPAGTLCITIAANIADTAILGIDACFPDSVVGFLAEQNHCETEFVEYFIRTAKENIERYAPATAQKNINLEILAEIAVVLPPLKEQQAILEEIDRRLSVTEELEATIETSLKRTERLRQTILQRAFAGGFA